MIYDTRENLLSYKGISALLDSSLKYLSAERFSGLAEGTYPLCGTDSFVIVQARETVPRSMARWESHGRYIDIQYLIAGRELIGFRSTAGMTVSEPYDAERDITFYKDDGGGFFTPMEPGRFVVCFPHDAHMPLVCVDGPKPVKKVVMKIKMYESNP